MAAEDWLDFCSTEDEDWIPNRWRANFEDIPEKGDPWIDSNNRVWDLKEMELSHIFNAHAYLHRNRNKYGNAIVDAWQELFEKEIKRRRRNEKRRKK